MIKITIKNNNVIDAYLFFSDILAPFIILECSFIYKFGLYL